MYYKGGYSPGVFLSRINLLTVISSILLIFCLGPGCSKEEQKPVQSPKVVVRMKMPVQQKPVVKEETKSEADKKASTVIEPSVLEGGASLSSLPVKPEEKKPPVEQREGYYRVRTGDSLFKIAGRKDVYGDSLKWPSIYRLNIDKLGRLGVIEDLQHTMLPGGFDLRFVTADEAAKNLAELGGKCWVVNVASVQDSKEIVPPVIALVKNGYHVYLTMAMVKGKEWMRLRVGFFKGRSETVAASKKIMAMVDVKDAWVTKINKRELDQFAGY